ncbi:MAG TPA: DUF4166 domain-containing protein [Caulobacterales bacterium]|nr:DUF4166 domain-containing protein [Caulobacterales bacterium]
MVMNALAGPFAYRKRNAARGGDRDGLQPCPPQICPPKNLEALVGAEGWARLPATARARFAAHVRAADYIGTGTFEANAAGRAFAWLGLMFGRPLPLNTGDAAVEIRVRAGPRGERWTRLYRFTGAAETVSSIKHAGARDWLEERAGPLIMRLSVFESAGALVFDCRDFRLRFGALEIALPFVLTPGRIRVEHRDFGGGRFAFTLEARHPWFGLTFRQRCACRDAGGIA